MKKLFSKILVFGMIAAMVLPMLCFSGAAAISGAIAASKTEITKDDTVVISYQITGNEEIIGSAQMTLFYDKAAFEYVSADSDYFDASGVKATVNADSTVRLTTMGGSKSTAAGAVFKVTFKPTAAAAAGTSYEFAFGSKGRTTLKVSGKTEDLITAEKSEEGVKVVSVSVKFKEKAKYTVTYKDGVDGAAFQTQTYTLEEGAATPIFSGTPARAGYTFNGWSPALASKVTANATYTAQWKEKGPTTYTVTYTDNAGGKAFANQKYTVEEGKPTPEFQGTPARAGYSFTGWSPAVSATVTKTVTYKAQWKADGTVPKTYTIVYEDGLNGAAFASQTFTAAEGADMPVFSGTPTREGYVFSGWMPAPAAKVTGDATFQAMWIQNTPTEYTITYKDGVGGTVFADQVYKIAPGSAVPAFSGTPKRDGFNFDGWDIPAVITGDTVITAKWSAAGTNYVTIRYEDGVDGEEIFEPQEYTVGYFAKTPAFVGTPRREGYTFAGWSPAVAETVLGNATYKAVWNLKAADSVSRFAELTEKEAFELEMDMSAADAGNEYIHELILKIPEDGYSAVKLNIQALDPTGNSSAIFNKTAVTVENMDTGVALYKGDLDAMTEEILIPLNGRADETVRVRVKMVVDSSVQPSAGNGNIRVRAALGEKDACGCILCAVIRTFGGPYCCCHLCVFILILILIILALAGVVIYLAMRLKRTTENREADFDEDEDDNTPSDNPQN